MKRIGTNGYRGPLTGNAYLPPGQYEVGDGLDIAGGVVPRKLAEYMVGIDLAWEVELPKVQGEAHARDTVNAVVEEHPGLTRMYLSDDSGQSIAGTATITELEWDADALDAMTVPELQDRARKRGIAYSGLKKAELIAALLGEGDAE